MALGIILLGAPGAGKGTVGKVLCEKLGICYISTGDAFRAAVAAKSELGRQVEGIMASGGLVPDEVTNKVVAERLSRPDCAKGFLLDGYPRTLDQAQFLDRTVGSAGLSMVFNVALSVEEIVRRLSSRRVCPKCKSVYNVISQPPKTVGVCDKCGEELVTRPDDAPDTIRKRIQVYEENTRPLEAYYDKRGLLVHVDNSTTPQKAVDAMMCFLGGRCKIDFTD